MTNSFPGTAQVVIVGGGIVGCSVAYHLTKLGIKEVVILERGKFTGGSTWHAAGLISQLRNSRTLIEIAKYGAELYASLEAETGHPTGFRSNGSITVARNTGRVDEINKIASLAHSFDIEIEPISLGEVNKLWPLMKTDDLVGAYYIPKDGQTVPEDTAKALAFGAIDRGAKLFEDTLVTNILEQDGTTTGVITSNGPIKSEFVVNCGGMWAREIGKMCGVKVPLHAAEHMYLVTNPMDIPFQIPCLRDPDEQIYFRRDKEEEGALLMGGFESRAKPWGMDGIPDGYNFSLLDPDWDHFKVFWDAATHRVPSMKEAGINRFYVSAESFTPDNRYIMGEAPELKNFFVAAGLNSTGIAAGAGVGKAVAEWIVAGHPTMDLTEVDIRRFHSYQNHSRYLYDRTVEAVGTLYGMHWPHLQPETARDVRHSPFHDRLTLQGACFGTTAGWERPNWYAPDGLSPTYKYSYGRQNWFDYSAKEHIAVRETVGLFDQSSFAKLLVQGRDAESLLQKLCANDVGVPPGRVVYTAMLNDRAGFEADITVTRLADDSYMVVTGCATENRDLSWIRKSIPSKSHVFVTNITSAYAVLSVMGPNSRALLSKLTDTDLSNRSFPYLHSREIEIGYSPVRATRITYVGELGWELYIPTEFALHVYDVITKEGNNHGLKLAGYHALESLRMEKGYRAWGSDLTDMDTPIEAGLQFAVKLEKPCEFNGKSALLTARNHSPAKRIAIFVLEDPDPLLTGDEPIFRNGALAGRTTSGSYGHTVERAVGLGYIENASGVDIEYIQNGHYQIEILGKLHDAKVSLRPPYDPKNRRVLEY